MARRAPCPVPRVLCPEARAPSPESRAPSPAPRVPSPESPATASSACYAPRTMWMRFTLALVTATALASAPEAANGIKDHPRVQQALKLLDVWLDAQRDYEQIPGLSVAVV